MSKNTSDDVKISKSMTWLLRHGAEKEGLQMRNDGFIRMDHLLQHRNLRNVTREQIFKIVENCSKQRFLIENFDGEPYIRANQGHSLKNIAVDMVEITESDNVDQCIHGTFYKSWDLIKKSGLSKMNRQHIHFSEDFPGSKNVISGMRQDCQVAIYVDVKLALSDGLKFYRSSNNVILCPGDEMGFLKPKYFLRAEDLKQGKELSFSKDE